MKNNSLIVHISLEEVGFKIAERQVEKLAKTKPNNFKHFEMGKYILSFDLKTKKQADEISNTIKKLPFVHKQELLTYEKGNCIDAKVII